MLALRPCVLIVVAVMLGGVARADTLPPLTPDKAASLQRAIRLWNPISIGLAKDGMATVAPADGYYAVTFPLASFPTTTEQAFITARATPGADGRWHLDGLTRPSPIVTDIVSNPGGKTTHMIQEYREQSGTAVIDATLATPSSGVWKASDSRLRATGGPHDFSVTVDQTVEQRDINPASPGRADFASIASVDKLAVRVTAVPNNASGAVCVTVRHIVMATQSSNLDLDKLTTLLPHAVAFATELRDAAKPVTLSEEQRAQAHELLGEIRKLSDGGKVTLTAEDTAVTVYGREGGLAKMVFSESVAAPDGKGEMRLRLELAGLSLPFLPPSLTDTLVPKKLVVAPSLTGLSMDDVFDVANRLIDTAQPKPDAVAADVEARLARAPITAGLDEVAIDVGPARLTAHGSVTVSGPSDIDGAARVEATGLDALIKRAGANPMLKQAVPVLIFLKGVGDTEGERTVWDIAYRDHKLTVNGTDFSAFMPFGK